MSKSNWAGNVLFEASEIIFPKSEAEVVDIVNKAIENGKTIRTIGSGHSFTDLCKTDEILLSLDAYEGIVSVDKDNKLATVKGGTKLKALGSLLFKHGLAMENLGDIDAQSLAGTISTGTHGTGSSFGSISTQVRKIKFVNGKGESITCSPEKNPDLFKAAQVSLGALGIILEITLQCVPTYKLLIENRKEKLDHVLETLEERKSSNRNFEYYWLPYTNTAWTKSSNIAEEGEPDKDSILNYLSELLLENYTFKALCEFARIFPSQNELVSKIVAQSVPTMKKLNYSHKVFATMRLVKFTEMEYNVPAETYQNVMKDIMRLVNSGKFPIHFPIENRWVRGDDIYLSPAYGRESAYIACHVYHKKDNRAYFTALEEIFRAYDGRPHWGKMNTLDREEISDSYPQFSRFIQFKKEHDPDEVFMNPYLKKLLG